MSEPSEFICPFSSKPRLAASVGILLKKAFLSCDIPIERPDKESGTSTPKPLESLSSSFVAQSATKSSQLAKPKFI